MTLLLLVGWFFGGGFWLLSKPTRTRVVLVGGGVAVLLAANVIAGHGAISDADNQVVDRVTALQRDHLAQYGHLATEGQFNERIWPVVRDDAMKRGWTELVVRADDDEMTLVAYRRDPRTASRVRIVAFRRPLPKPAR